MKITIRDIYSSESVFVTYLQQTEWLKFVAEYKLHTNKKGNILQQNE